MVTAALSDGDRAGIPYTEPFSRHTAYIRFTGCCPVEGYVADDDIL
jgi:hypothetical protein